MGAVFLGVEQLGGGGEAYHSHFVEQYILSPFTAFCFVQGQLYLFLKGDFGSEHSKY